jgi:hypothetical protein
VLKEHAEHTRDDERRTEKWHQAGIESDMDTGQRRFEFAPLAERPVAAPPGCYAPEEQEAESIEQQGGTAHLQCADVLTRNAGAPPSHPEPIDD